MLVREVPVLYTRRRFRSFVDSCAPAAATIALLCADFNTFGTDENLHYAFGKVGNVKRFQDADNRKRVPKPKKEYTVRNFGKNLPKVGALL